MSKYKRGRIISGQVTGIENYGIFVGLDEFYSGLIHISEVSNGYVKDITDIVRIGETIFARVIDVDDDNCHVKLSIKNVDYRPSKKKKYKINETESGFLPLKEHLPIWIDEKLKKFEKN